MAKMMHVDDNVWVNLDLIVKVEEQEFNGGVKKVILFDSLMGNGRILPADISLHQVLEAMTDVRD